MKTGSTISIHTQLRKEEGPHIGLLIEDQTARLAGAVAGPRFLTQQDRPIRTGRPLHPGGHLAGVRRIDHPANELWLSPISLLEIAIKVRINKLRLVAPFGVLFPTQLIANRISLWPIEVGHTALLMPLHHKDPFDRLIAATTLVEGLTLVSADATFDGYGLNRLW